MLNGRVKKHRQNVGLASLVIHIKVKLSYFTRGLWNLITANMLEFSVKKCKKLSFVKESIVYRDYLFL